jgi:hypothetical protein
VAAALADDVAAGLLDVETDEPHAVTNAVSAAMASMSILVRAVPI